jgi:hypothetical protein
MARSTRLAFGKPMEIWATVRGRLLGEREAANLRHVMQSARSRRFEQSFLLIKVAWPRKSSTEDREKASSIRSRRPLGRRRQASPHFED